MLFEYKGKFVKGGKTKGKIEADNKAEALKQLSDQGVVVLGLKELSGMNKDITLFRRLKNADFVMFLRQYSTLINAGITISEATKTMHAQAENKLLKDTLGDVDKQVDRGEPLSVAIERHPKVVPPLLVNMIYAGEKSGRLDDILENMAGYYEKQYKLKRKMISSLMYPGVVGLLAIAMTVFMLVYVVPTFASMFESMGEDIPAYTKFVMSVSDFIVDYWYIVLSGLAILGVVMWILSKSYKVMFKFDTIIVRVPLLGNMIHKMLLVRTVQTLGLLMEASISILDSLEITEKIVTNRAMKKSLLDIKTVLTNGGTMSSVMMQYPMFPILLAHMVQIGERTGQLEHMLAKSTEFYADEVDQIAERFGSIIEPILIVFLGVVVGGIVLAVIIPMFSLYDSF